MSKIRHIYILDIDVFKWWIMNYSCVCTNFRLQKAVARASSGESDDDDDDEPETEEQKRKQNNKIFYITCIRIWIKAHINRYNINFPHSEKRIEFEKRRKLHYNEFEAVRKARQLIEEDEDDDDDEENKGSSSTQ